MTKTEDNIIKAAYYYSQAGSHEETVRALREIKRAVIADIDASSKPTDEPKEGSNEQG
jgi:hypothetical protein